MRIDYAMVDAFVTEQPFSGNPAGVCLLPQWLSDTQLQQIAAQNNLSDTAYVVNGEAGYEIRWFTPTQEVDLCGHATLASGYRVMQQQPQLEQVCFDSPSGPLLVTQDGEQLTLQLPSRPPQACELPDQVAQALGQVPQWCGQSRDLLLVYESEAQVRALRPDFAALAAWPGFAVIATAPGEQCDFVSRFFAPGAGVDEDPVTGSAHSTLVPYWSERLGGGKLKARQLSARGGLLYCQQQGDTVILGGQCRYFLQGEIMLGDDGATA